jgi:hypothetical protein
VRVQLRPAHADHVVARVRGSRLPYHRVFLRDRANLTRLTNLRRGETTSAFLNVTGTRAFFLASADPLGTNPYRLCQMFSINARGRRLRHLTDASGRTINADGGFSVELPGPFAYSSRSR